MIQGQTAEVEGRLRFESFIGNLLGRFISSAESPTHAAIENAIRSITEFLGLDQGLLVQWPEEGALPLPTHSWTVPGGKKAPASPGTEVVPWVHAQAVQGKIVMFTAVDDLPEEAERDKEFFRTSGRKSLISLPMKINGRVAGALVFASLFSEIRWPEDVVRGLRLVVDFLAGILERERNRREMEDRLRFEMLLAETSARLINLPGDRLGAEILDIIRVVCDRLGMDRITLWLLSDREPGTMRLVYFYDKGALPAPKCQDGRKLFPWVVDKVLAGEVLRISRLSDMPPEAAPDKEYFRMYGTRSTLIIPLSTGGSVFGAVTFSCVRTEKEWQESIVSRLMLLAQIFASALVRQEVEKQLCARLREIGELKKRLEDENVYLHGEVRQLSEQSEIVGQSIAIKRVLMQAEQVAPTDTTILIQGETGTGKELLARAIHGMSRRKDRLLVTVNCAALPPTLIESELFGREKGAYTGALTRMAGRFEVADGSTLFLDEIGELPLELQAKLLRVIEEGCFERLGSTRTIRVDVRLIAATNRDLAREVEEGRFRRDLFYRLSVFPIIVPPLRERPDDIPLMAWSFVAEFKKEMGKRIDVIPRKTMDMLKSYSWPGNGRELRNVIERSMIVSNGRTLNVILPKVANGLSANQSLEEIERRHIMDVLEKTSWRVTGKGGAAEVLGLKGTTLQSKMKKLRIERPVTG